MLIPLFQYDLMETAGNSTLGPAVCRVCLSGESSIPYLGKSAGEPLISPCHCKGTMGLYHRSCLEHWLSTSKTVCCEICKFKYEIGQKNRGFVSYVRSRGWDRKTGGQGRSLLADLICLLVLSPLAIGVTVLCVKTAFTDRKRAILLDFDDDSEENEENSISSHATETIAMLVMALFVIVVYMLWLSVTVVYHFNEFRGWQSRNQIIFIVDQLDSDQSLQYNSSLRMSTSRYPLVPRKLRGFFGILTRTHRRLNSPTFRDPVIGLSPQLIEVFERPIVVVHDLNMPHGRPRRGVIHDQYDSDSELESYSPIQRELLGAAAQEVYLPPMTYEPAETARSTNSPDLSEESFHRRDTPELVLSSFRSSSNSHGSTSSAGESSHLIRDPARPPSAKSQLSTVSHTRSDSQYIRQTDVIYDSPPCQSEMTNAGEDEANFGYPTNSAGGGNAYLETSF